MFLNALIACLISNCRLCLMTGLFWICFSPNMFCQVEAVKSATHYKYRSIVQAISQKDYSKAIDEAHILFKETNNYPQLYLRIAQASLASGSTHQAIAMFNSLTQSDSTAAQGYYGLGLIAQLNGDHNGAQEFYQKSFATQQDSPYSLFAAINSAKNAGKISELINYLHSLAKNFPDYSSVYLALGYYHYLTRQYEKAAEIFDKEWNTRHKSPEACYYRVAVRQDAGRNLEALNIFNQCYAVAKTQMNEEHLQDFRILEAISYLNLGNYENSETLFNQILTNSRQLGDVQYEEVSLAYLGLVDELQDKYSSALSNYIKAYEIAKRNDTAYGIKNLKRYPGRIGRIYYNTANYLAANEQFEIGLKLARTIKDNLLETLMLKYLGDSYLKQGFHSVAITHYQRAAEINERIPNSFNQTLAHDSLSDAYLQLGEYQMARTVAEKGLKIAEDRNFFEAELWFLGRLGEIHTKMNKLSQASVAFKKALAIATNKNSHHEAWKALSGLGQISRAQSDLLTASQHYKNAIGIMEAVRTQVSSNEERAGFFQDKVKIYKDLVATLIELHGKEATKGYDAEAFDYAERVRGRAFLDLLAEAKVNLDQSLDPALLEKRQIIENEISRINSELVAERSKELSKQDSARLNQLDKALRENNEKLDNWVREVRLSDPRYAALKFPEPVKLPEAQKLLNERSAMLAFSLDEQESFLFAVTSKDYKVFKLRPAAEIRSRVDDLLGAIHGKGRSNSPMGTFKASARELYQLLIEPANELLADKRDLIVVADESLHRLPFEVLLAAQPEGNSAQWSYLVKDFAVSYAPSVSVLAFLKNQEQHTTPKDFVAFGDPIFGKDDQMNDQSKMLASANKNYRGLSVKPERIGFWRKFFGSFTRGTRGASNEQLQFKRLPFSRSEAIEIARFFPAGKADLFLGKEATEENAKTKDLLGQYGIVHFSTHGLPNEDRPRFSSLILSSPTKGQSNSEAIEDGWLSAYEIFNLKLNANLVVLSACETGLGKEVKGEGLMSLTRAFIYAGAPSVVVSLWKVNDAASKDLMVAFYRHLRGDEKISYSEALRRAQLEMIGKGNAPKFWAPFVLVGKP